MKLGALYGPWMRNLNNWRCRERRLVPYESVKWVNRITNEGVLDRIRK